MFYFLTLDKCKIDSMPTKEDYKELIAELSLFHLFREVGVHCYEHKTKMVLKKKFKKWLHYHTIIVANQYIKYTDLRVEGYSIKLKHLESKFDVAKVAAYICKNKIDLINIIFKEE